MDSSENVARSSLLSPSAPKSTICGLVSCQLPPKVPTLPMKMPRRPTSKRRWFHMPIRCCWAKNVIRSDGPSVRSTTSWRYASRPVRRSWYFLLSEREISPTTVSSWPSSSASGVESEPVSR